MELSGYHFEFIHESSHFAVQRAREVAGSGTILVRSPIGDHASSMQAKWLEQEYALRTELDASWAIMPLNLVRHEGRLSLVMEDPGGQPLDKLLRGPMDIEAFLEIAIQATTALSGMHRKGLVHKDIKPANIFLDMAGGVLLTGFGLASRLPRERMAPVPLEVIAGTFAYMAPEQTGRMNRSMDARSDLYSLGITFYEMATGRLPFSAEDPLEWVHCHTALQPVSPNLFASVPEAVSAIIMKLLAKTTDERYQTAEGLAADLRQCQSQLKQHGFINAFPLGANDTSDQLLISERLYGRDAEISRLLAAFDRVVASGTPELVLVSGYSGVGKSSVVNELHKVLVPPRGIFASGKFDQYRRGIPYATLAQAFQSLVRQILGKNELELKYWRESLQEALGVNGQIIIDLIPELEIVIGRQPQIAELSAQDAANRFQMVFRKFLGVFARPEHPLALFLDDLQWLDIGTLQLLQHLLLDADVKHVLFVGAYRDNEVTNAHPLMRMIDDIRAAGLSLEDIVLSPLSSADIGQLIEDAIHCSPGAAAPLTRLVYEKTGGNPFFVIQFMTELAEKKFLTFDPTAAAWRWDIKHIQAQGFTENVVDLMAVKLNRLPIKAREALQRLACLGNTASLATLVMVQEQPVQSIQDALWDAVHAGLVLREASTYRFLHDRVQEAAYAMIPVSERAAAHLKIGRLLASAIEPDQKNEKIFDIVSQYERGLELIKSQREKDSVAELFSAAAQQARNSTAYGSALKYLGAGRTLLGKDGWERQYDLTFAFELNMAECEFLNGNSKAAAARIAELIRRGRTKVDLAAAYRLRTTMHVVMSENPQAVNTALECLRLFGIDMSPHPSLADVSAMFADIQTRLKGRPIEDLIDLPLAHDPDVEAAMSVLSVMWAPAIFTDEPLVGLHVCHMVRLTLDYGVTAASAQGLGWYGIMLGHLSFGDYQDGYKFGCLARDLVEKHKFSSYEAKALYSLHMISLWTQPITTVLETIRATFLACIKTGDITIACYACNHMVTDRLTRGDHLDEVWQESERSMAFVDKVGYQIVIEFIRSQQRWILQMQGRTESFATLDGRDFNEAAFEKDLTPDSMATMVFWYWILKGKARYMSGRFDEAAEAFARARPLYWGSAGHIQIADFQFYSALTLAALDQGETVDSVALERKAHMLAAKDELARWAQGCPSTFAVRHELISAEIARIEGQTLEACRLYERSINLARDNGLIQYEAIAHELAARFYINHGLDTSGLAHFRHSRECYRRWGAYGKVQHLDGLYPGVRQTTAPFSAINTTDAPIGNLDILAVVKANQAISRDIILDDLVKTLLTIVIEVAGAERGILLLFRNEMPSIVADGTTVNGHLEIALRHREVSIIELPLSALQYVIRTKESLILDDAARKSEFSTDEYVHQNQSKSIVLLPIVKQSKLGGVLYLENSLTSHAFTSDRLALLELISSQAAISLENARLHTELQRSEAFLAEGQRHSSTATWTWNVKTGELRWSTEHFHLLGFRPGDVIPTFDLWFETVHPEDRLFVKETLDSAVTERRPFSFEYRGTPRLGEEKYFLAIGREMERRPGESYEYMGTLIDISERKRGEQALINAQEELRRVSQLMVIGELAASIAHEVNQPIASMVTNANACKRWLADEKLDIARARKTAESIVSEGHRAGEIIKGIYRLAKRHPPEFSPFDINAIIRDVLALSRSGLEREEVLLRTDLDEGPLILHGDAVQLRQVILNMVKNSIEAMSSVNGRPRLLNVVTRRAGDDQIEVAVEDTGTGLDPAIVNRIFDPFFTTKPAGLGMGLSICRTIIESHGGTLWLFKTGTEGTIIQFSLPVVPKMISADAA